MSRLPRAAILFILLCIGAMRLQAQIPSFPGALGYGATATGAWTLSGTNHTGGTVYYVTNLDASGAGSFAAGVGTSGNIVEFKVGGSIFLDGPVTVASNVSIEGQTAPGGIMIYGGEMSCYGKTNIICRYLVCEDGTSDPNYPGSSATNSSANACNLGNATNCIFDHCSFEFASYNNIDASGTGSTNDLTWQNCIFADPILEQQFNLHIQATYVSVLDCLFANSGGRNPLAKTNMQYVNNIIYNYRYALTTGNSGDVCSWDVINNYFITGPSNTTASDTYYQVDSSQSAYAIGNYEDSSNNGALGGSAANTIGSATPLSTYYSSATTSLPTVSAASAFYQVTSNAGMLPHDQVDSQVVTQVLSLGTAGRTFNTQTDTELGNDGYGVITSGTALPDSDNSGMPDDWRAAVGISMTNPAISGSTSSTGYTYLENYLAWKAQPNAWVARSSASQPTSVSINLGQYANGFATTASTYTVSNLINGTVTQSGSGGSVVKFVPTSGVSGLGGFKWSVTNSATTLTGTFGVLISQSGSAQSVVWKGDGIANNWDLTTANWTATDSNVATDFATGDPVTFTDTGSASPAINIATAVSPGSVTVNTSVNNYTFSGSGSIGGTGSLVKEGTSTLFVSNTNGNTFSGGTIIDSGVVYINNTSSLGTGTVTLNGGDLEMTNGISPANAIAVTLPSTLGIDGGNVTLDGTMSGSSPLTINFNTDVLLTPAGSCAAYTGTLNVNGTGNLRLNNSASWGFPNAVVNLDGPVSLTNRASTSPGNIYLGALNGVASSSLAGSSQVRSGTAAYTIGGLNLPSVFAGAIENTSDQVVGITATGTSMLTLTGTSTYTGPTLVTSGTLLLLGPLGATPVTVSSGATMISNSSIAGSLTLNGGGSLYPGSAIGLGSVGTLTIADGLTIAGGTSAATGANLYYNLSNSPTSTTANDLITATAGTLSTSGTVNFFVNLTNGGFGAGTYSLINGEATMQAPGGGNPGMILYLPIPTGAPTRQTFSLTRAASGARGGYVDLVVTGNAGSLVWTGTSGATWDLNTTADWSGGSPDTFYDLDTVTFDDSDTGGGIVLLSGTLVPGVVDVANNVTNYTFSGAGGLTGDAQLVKSGTASLTILNTGNTTSGAFYLDAGTLTPEASLGTGTIYLNGGTLSMGAAGFVTLGNPIVVEASSTINAAGNVYLTGNTGATLSSTSSAVILSLNTAGILSFNNTMSGFAGTIELGTSTGMLRLNGGTDNSDVGGSATLFDLGTSTASLANRNGGITVNLGALQGGPGTSLTGRQSGSGATSSTYVVGALDTSNTFAGAIKTGGDLDGVNVTKVGTGIWTLSGTSTFLGNVEMEAGTLLISGSFNNGNLDFEAQDGATLNLAGGVIATATVQIDNGARLTGNGIIDAGLTNEGTAVVSGGALTVNGAFQNSGTLTVDGSASLVVNLPSGAGFINNGLLDIMDSPQTVLPAGYVNNGTILTSALVTVKNFTKSANTFSVTIQSYTGHTYQLEKSADLNTWQTVGSLQSGSTGSALILTDTNASQSGMVYQIGVGP